MNETTVEYNAEEPGYGDGTCIALRIPSLKKTIYFQYEDGEWIVSIESGGEYYVTAEILRP